MIIELSIGTIVLLTSSLIYCSIQALLTWGWIIAKRQTGSTQRKIPFSVVIAARDEHENLSQFLPSVLNQQYPDFEVIVILDRCSDQSDSLLRLLQSDYSVLDFLEVTHVPEGWSPKKWALSLGIKKARHEWIVLTDADCWVSSIWLQEISKHIDQDCQLILGLGMYQESPGWINQVIQMETVYTAFQYIGAAGIGFPYMGVGRNMAYHKNTFQVKQGLKKFKSSLSGDDDLLINKYGRANHTRTMITKNSISYSIPKTTFRTWLKQKFRHLSASNHYSIQSKFLLGIFHLSHLCIYSVFLLTLLIKTNLVVDACIFVGRLFLSYLLYIIFSNQFPLKKSVGTYLLLDPFIFFYNLIIVPMGLINRPEWK